MTDPSAKARHKRNMARLASLGRLVTPSSYQRPAKKKAKATKRKATKTKAKQLAAPQAMTGAELQVELNRAGLTQEGTVAALDISRRMLNYYLSGAWTVPTKVALAVRALPTATPKSAGATRKK